MKRLRIVIKGKVVQDIGFRLFLYERADEMGIPEFQARNIKEGVEILVGGEDFSVNNFMDLLRKERPERAEVEAIEIEAYEGQIKPIERFTQSFIPAQLDKFVDIGMEMLATQKEIKKDTGMMLEKQDLMLDKQDKMLEKQDLMLEKQDETIREIRSLREDLKSYMEERFERMEREIGEIKAKIGMV